MAKHIVHFTQLDKQVTEYLFANGIDVSKVKNDYTLERKNGQTLITITLYADDFMLIKEDEAE